MTHRVLSLVLSTTPLLVLWKVNDFELTYPNYGEIEQLGREGREIVQLWTPARDITNGTKPSRCFKYTLWTAYFETFACSGLVKLLLKVWLGFMFLSMVKAPIYYALDWDLVTAGLIQAGISKYASGMAAVKYSGTRIPKVARILTILGGLNVIFWMKLFVWG